MIYDEWEVNLDMNYNIKLFSLDLIYHVTCYGISWYYIIEKINSLTIYNFQLLLFDIDDY